MLASNIVTIGDSWAWLIAANGPGSAPAAPGFTNSFQQMLDTFHPGSTVYNESFGGGLAAQHVVDLAGITSRINAHPDADIVWLSSGGNDIVGGSFVGGYTTLLNGAQKDALKNRIVNDVTTIANHILSIRPDIQVVIEGYDYINIWDTYSPVSAGDGNRVGLYGIVRYDTGFPQFDHAQNLAQNADFNSFMKDVGTGKNSIGINNSRIHYINNFGFHSSTFGYSGFLGNVPGTGSFPPDQYSALPTDDSFMNNGDPIHLNSAGYLNLTLRAQQEFFNTAMQNASLSTNTTSLNCGNVRVGDAGSSQTVTASNSGPNFTKVQSLVFPGASGQFTGSGSSHNPLFKDPTLGSDTATSAAYGFSPNARGNFNTNLTVTSDSGNRPLALAGNGVGPVYSSVSTLDLGTVFVDGSTSQSIDISNITTDGDLGMLTDLSLLTATITGPDAAAFSIDSFTPLTVVEAGATQGYMIQFDASGLTPGVKTATLTFTTDEGSSFGTLGSQFQVTLTAGVDPGVTASIGGPYSGDEGSSIPLSAAASTGATLYEWDLDNDGQYDDAVGENVNFSSPDNGVFNIHLRINGPGGPTDSTTVTVNNVAPTAAISGTTAIYRGEEVTFTLTAADASSVDQAGLFTFEIDWDGNGTVDETLASVPSGTAVQHTFASVTSNNIQVRATDKDGSTGAFSQMPITVTPHVLRDDGFGNTDLIWGGTSGLDAVFVLGQAPALSVFVQIEGTVPVSRLDHFGSAVTGKVIIHGYGFSDVLIAELAGGNVVEIHGGDGDDVIVGGSLGDFLYGDGGNDTLIGGTRVTDGDDMLFGGEGRDTLFGHLGADTLDGGVGEDLLISDRFSFSNVPAAVQQIANEWKSARPYAERVSNILGTTSTGVNGGWILDPASTIVDDGAEDILLGGLGESDWFFYDFDQDLLGDTIEIGEELTDSEP